MPEPTTGLYADLSPAARQHLCWRAQSRLVADIGTEPTAVAFTEPSSWDRHHICYCNCIVAARRAGQPLLG